MSDEQILLDGTSAWVSTNADFSVVTVLGPSGEIAMISRPLGGTLLGADVGFGLSPSGAPFYDPSDIAPPDQSTTLTNDGNTPALAPDTSGDIVTVPTS